MGQHPKISKLMQVEDFFQLLKELLNLMAYIMD